MKKDKMLIAIILSFCIVFFTDVDVAFAQEIKEPSWWEIATGILAIPAAIIGIAYSYILIQKTRLESEKTKLEITEKQIAIQKLTKGQKKAIQDAVQPLAQVNIALYLVLRFVILYLILVAWGFVEDSYRVISGGIVLGFETYANIDLLSGLDIENFWHLIFILSITGLPKIIYWVVFFAIGLPLFKDINKLIGLNLRDFFRWERKEKSVGEDTNKKAS